MKATRWAQGLFFLNAAIWVTLGVASVLRIGGTPGQEVTAWAVAILMFGNAGAMALSGALLKKRRMLFYLFALAVLAVNVVLTFTDQVGALDWITLAIDLALLGILLVARKQFIPVDSSPAGKEGVRASATPHPASGRPLPPGEGRGEGAGGTS